LRSNPTLYEWLLSPIVYTDSPLRSELKAMFEAHASPRALAFHYWSIARTQWRREIEGKSEVKLKKYFYVIRPLLSLAWIAAHASPPPMAIDDLLRAQPMPDAPRRAVDVLLAQKRDTPELGLRSRIAAIDDWAMASLERLDPENLALSDEPRQDMRADADGLFRRIIGIAD
jgi:hypothetical protein